ncbi:hypothetical protein ACQUHV_04230 [Pseudomonas aeruginosa]|uniref:hypothetical protein n=1 Tax=Pseudomonas aeruginosa TaxID=287 RepID=UPI003FD2B29C
MSSTQHQLIEQCATRLRGIVEALDNIHDTSPQRWSTDLDDVHSSAESLLALIKDQAPARSEASFEEWLANELEGEDGQPVPAAVCDIALARRAFNHWPKLEQPAKVGGVRFSAGVSSRLVVEAAQRLYEFESTPEKEAERIERLQAFREQCFEPLGTEFSKVLSDNLPELLSTAQAEHAEAEAERPEVVAFRYHCTNAEGEPLPGWFYSDDAGTLGLREPLMTVAQHERIVEARWNRAMDLLLDHVSRISEKFKAERDAAQARVAELEGGKVHVEARECIGCGHSGINDAADGFAACNACGWIGKEPATDECPGCQRESVMTAACPKCHCRYTLIADGHITAPVAQAGQVPQAWLDVQAERRRQIKAEGWTPQHDDEHADGQMAQAAGCYALHAGGIGTDWPDGRQNGSALFWPWDKDWWKPTTPRRDLVKACALALAEIERLDRACISQSPQPGATTASS